MLQNLKTMHHQELFLYGFFISYGLGTAIATILAFLLNQPLNMIVTLFATFITLLTYLHYLKHHDYHFSALALLWNASIVVFAHVLLNHYSIDIAFTLLVPMAASLLLSKKSLLFHGSVYLLILIALFIYGFMAYPEHPFLHNPNLMASYFMLTFFVLAFGATYHYAIASSYERLEKANKQKAFLLKEIHHRVKNNLNIVASILGLEKFESDTKEVHKLINQNKLRIESIAMIHEILYKSDDLENIDFKTYISKLTNHILATESTAEIIDIQLDIVELKLNIEAMIQFGIIINELVTNSIKHAFEGNKGIITIVLQKHETHYKLIYHDNGVGLRKTKFGFGQNLIKISAQQLDATLDITSNDGLTYTLIFTKEQA